MQRFISWFFILFHGPKYLSLCQHHSGLISFALSFETKNCESSNFVLLPQVLA